MLFCRRCRGGSTKKDRVLFARKPTSMIYLAFRKCPEQNTRKFLGELTIEEIGRRNAKCVGKARLANKYVVSSEVVLQNLCKSSEKKKFILWVMCKNAEILSLHVICRKNCRDPRKLAIEIFQLRS